VILGQEGGSELIDEVLKLNFLIGGCSTLMVEKKTLNEINGFDEDFERHQDLELLIRLLREGRIGYLDQSLVTKYHTGKPSVDTAEEARIKFLRKFSDEVVRLEIDGPNIIDKHLFNLSLIFFSNGEFKRGIPYCLSTQLFQVRNLGRLLWSINTGIRY
jgi:hypothetical protein